MPLTPVALVVWQEAERSDPRQVCDGFPLAMNETFVLRIR